MYIIYLVFVLPSLVYNIYSFVLYRMEYKLINMNIESIKVVEN